MSTALTRPTSIAEVQAAVRDAPPGTRILAHGRGTKPPLSTPPEGAVALDVSSLSGIIEYEPGEFTFTALAGTPIAEIDAPSPPDALRICRGQSPPRAPAPTFAFPSSPNISPCAASARAYWAC